jgi:acetolactate synthase-1/2/3 large subunit
MLQALARRGVRVAFGIPGGLISPVFDALAEVPEIELVMTRHEGMAAYCAMGHALATGLPALVLTTGGPGITNAITGIAAAFVEGIPLIAIGGDVATNASTRGAIQDGSTNGIDAVSMVRTITRFSGRVDHPAGAQAAAQQAFACAMGPRPGPVFLALPLDVGTGLAPFASAAIGSAPAAGEPDAAACRDLGERLRRASRPLLVAGNGARGAAIELRQLAERLAVPVVTTPHSKGVFPDTHPLCLGGIGLGGHPSAEAYLAARPDVVCVIGSRLGDYATNGWTVPLGGTEATIQIDREAWLIGRNYPVTMGILGEASVVLQRTLESLPRDVARPSREVGGIRRSAAPARCAGRGGLHPAHALAGLQAAFPDAVYAVDQGEHCAHAIHWLDIDDADGFHTMVGLASMGTGIGVGIGLRKASRARPVVAICGDGGFAMHAGEVLSCVEHGIDVVVAVMNDGRWNMVDHGFRAVYGRAPRGLPSHVADIAGVARSFGALGVRVEHEDDLAPEVLHSLARRGRPLVLDIRIDAAPVLSVGSRSAALRRATRGAVR